MPAEVPRRLPLLEQLDAATREAVVALAEPVRLGRGRAVFLAGDAATALFVVLSGKIKITRRSRQSPDPVRGRDGEAWAPPAGAVRESVLWLMGPGDVFGEQALLDWPRHLDQATCVTACEVLRLPVAGVLRIMDEHPGLGRLLVEQLAARLRRADDQTVELALGNVPGRLAAALLHLADRFGETTPQGVLVQHDLTQSELAQLVGASRETVNKGLTDLAARGWIVVKPRSVVITEPERLQSRTD